MQRRFLSKDLLHFLSLLFLFFFPLCVYIMIHQSQLNYISICTFKLFLQTAFNKKSSDTQCVLTLFFMGVNKYIFFTRMLIDVVNVSESWRNRLIHSFVLLFATTPELEILTPLTSRKFVDCDRKSICVEITICWSTIKTKSKSTWQARDEKLLHLYILKRHFLAYTYIYKVALERDFSLFTSSIWRKQYTS